MQRKTVPRVVLLKNFLAKGNEEDDEGEDDKKHHSNTNYFLFTNHSMSCLHVGDNNRPQAAVLAHKSCCAVTEEGTMSVYTGTAILTFIPWTAAVAFIYIFPTTAECRNREND